MAQVSSRWGLLAMTIQGLRFPLSSEDPCSGQARALAISSWRMWCSEKRPIHTAHFWRSRILLKRVASTIGTTSKRSGNTLSTTKWESLRTCPTKASSSLRPLWTPKEIARRWLSWSLRNLGSVGACLRAKLCCRWWLRETILVLFLTLVMVFHTWSQLLMGISKPMLFKGSIWQVDTWLTIW